MVIVWPDRDSCGERGGGVSMQVRPCTLAQANALVSEIHRHHKPCVGHRFSLALHCGLKLCGVAICGRPVSRKTDPYQVLEITRCATDGTKNAITKLLGAVCRAAKAMGYKSVQTFTLPSEGGASLRAAGFTLIGQSEGGDWNVPSRKGRRTDQPQEPKWKWSKSL